MNEILTELSRIGIVPVIALDEAKDASPLAEALCSGGLPCAEVTFRTAAAEEAIRIMTREFPDMLVGAGTVLTMEQADRAAAAGARFIVSPGFNPAVVEHCISMGLPVIPGCSNPSDIERALALDLKVVKFFPAEASGGLAMIRSLAAPYGDVKFMPTGGIQIQNLTSYLAFDRVAACGGSWMVKQDLIRNGQFETIRQLSEEAVSAVLGFEVRHVGINAADPQEADQIASAFDSTFGFRKKTGNSSVFAGTGVEVMKSPYLGLHGHIAVQTDSIDRAVWHLERRGVEFDHSTAKYNAAGKMAAIYLKQEFGGFAVHLVQK